MRDPEKPRLTVLAGGRARGAAAPGPPEEDPAEPAIERTGRLRGVLLFLAALLAVRLLVAALPGLAADEAYYWAWGRRLAFGYYDHPPLVAWTIRASTALFGGGELGVRALGVLLGVGAVAALAASARRPWITAAACASLPLFALGGLLATPDVPLIFGWALCLAGLARGGRGWLLAGLGFALAVLGKHTGLLLLPLLPLARPKDLRTRWPWLGLLLALALLAPHLAWLARHDWVTLRFQLGHGLALDAQAPAPRPGLAGLGTFLAGQVGLVSPLLLICFGAYWAVGWMERGAVRLWWLLSFPIFAFFAACSMLAPAEANWPAPAYLGAALGLGHLSARWRRVAWLGVGFAAVFSALVTVHALHPFWPLPRDPTLSLVGGEVLGQAVEAWGVSPVYTARYQEAAWIAYYGKVRAEVLAQGGRRSQYDLWPREPLADHALFVRPWRQSPPEPVDRLWVERDGPNTVVAPDGLLRQAGRWQVYELRGLREQGAAVAP